MSTNTAAVSVLIYPTFIASMNVEPNDLKITKVFHTLVSNGFNIKNKYYGNNWQLLLRTKKTFFSPCAN